MQTKRYKRIIFHTNDVSAKELLTAWLSVFDWEGFEEQDNALIAYTKVDSYNEKFIQEILDNLNLDIKWKIKEVQEKNWNEVWEKQFQALTIDNLYIRADFHAPAPPGKEEVIINPKMSFGTGHHATTELMIRMLLRENLKGKSLIDMGTGTGILAIVAEKKGAGKIFAIDHDVWAIENTKENLIRNHCEKVQVFHGDARILNILPEVDFVLANINRNIILNDLKKYVAKMKSEGKLLLSGFLISDEPVILNSLERQGLKLVQKMEKDGWLGMKFVK